MASRVRLRRRGRRLTTFAVALAATVAIAGCGDDDGGDGGAAAPVTTATSTPDTGSSQARDRREITAVIRRSLIQDDPAAECRTLTTRLIGVIYGSPSRCRRVSADDDDDDPEAVRVSGIRVDGERAVARIQASGDKFDDVSGGLALAREGGSWKIDDLQSDLLEALLRAGVQQGALDDKPLLDSRSVRTCFVSRLSDLPDRRLRDLAYDAIGDRQGADDRLGRLLIACLSATREGRAALRRQFESSVRESERVPRAVRDCLIRRLRQTVSSREVAALVAARAEGRAPSPRTERQIELAGLACRRVPG